MQPALRTIRRECMEVLFVNTLTERSNLDHLRKQAKDLLRLYHRGDASAFKRLRDALPAARGRSDANLAAQQLRLHDMQSCIAREHGFASWSELKDGVELRRAQAGDARTRLLHVLKLIYGGDLAGGLGRPKPAVAARALAEQPDLPAADAWLACAVGDERRVRSSLAAEPDWVNHVGGVLRISPLIAVTHSSLLKLPEFRPGLLRCLKLLLDAGADPDSFYMNRSPPHSLEQPGGEKFTAIYGAAGKLHDVDATAMLLAAGADANDNESLYHSIDDPDRELPCMKLLLAAGTRVEGTNALAKILDFDHLAGLKLLLAHTRHGDPDLNRILHWAIYRGRSAAHVRALLDAGANPRAPHAEHASAFRHAAANGLPEVMRLLDERGDGEPVSDAEKFVCACAQANESEARRLLAASPSLLSSLSASQLKQLPNLAMSGRDDAVRLMVELGWPIATRGGDIDGSALNWAVFRGRPELTEFLLAHGADFREPHGYGSDVLGTLCWASNNEPRADGDWVRCAAALRSNGLPPALPMNDAASSEGMRTVSIDGRTMSFPVEVAEMLLAEEARGDPLAVHPE
jgi:ankyrin repeat protein